MSNFNAEYITPVVDVIETDVEVATLVPGSFPGEDSNVEPLI